MSSLDLLELYYKKYTHSIRASDYIEWAKHHLYLDIIEIKKLASMKEPFNLFELEEMFSNVMKALQQKPPPKEQCLHYHLKHLHSQLLTPVKNAASIVKEIYNCTIAHHLFDEQMIWQEISDAIDDFHYGDNDYGYTKDKMNEMIVTHARRTWHTKISKIDFKEFIGQKVTTVEANPNFIIQLEKGAIMIECPWRIRDTDVKGMENDQGIIDW